MASLQGTGYARQRICEAISFSRLAELVVEACCPSSLTKHAGLGLGLSREG